MLDDEFQLPMLAARYWPTPGAGRRKRAFLLGRRQGAPREAPPGTVLRELALVARETRAYADDPRATNLVASSGETRRTGARRAGATATPATPTAASRWTSTRSGRPRALEATAAILAALRGLGIPPAALDSLVPDSADGAARVPGPISASLARAIATWTRRARALRRGARAGGDRRRVESAKLATLLPTDRRVLAGRAGRRGAAARYAAFLALALDSVGRPIAVASTDPATELFLVARRGPAERSTRARPFLRPYPVGLFVPKLGPVVANDAYAPPPVWAVFDGDAYHSPRVVWGREVNLLLLGLATDRPLRATPRAVSRH